MLPEMITLSESYIQVWERLTHEDVDPAHAEAEATVKMEE